MYNLSFISKENFELHVSQTLATYNDTIQSIDLNSFNSNVIDPIKLLFDKSVYKQTFESVITQEIARQRDKSNNNAIGYFHQNMFRYIKHCTVPKEYWDVIYDDGEKSIYVEMKNKHNTMNSASSQKTYIKLQNQALQDKECLCYLVEAIAPVSRDITWKCSVDGQRVENERIRRVSIDKFYAEVTGIKNSFYQICRQLPETINELILKDSVRTVQKDTVIEELKRKKPDTLTALYLLAFETYEGFSDLVKNPVRSLL